MSERISRAVHLIDIENMLGTSDPTEAQVAAYREAYQSQLAEGDLVIIAFSHRASAAVAFGWPVGKQIMRSGQDGADLALIESIRNDPAVKRSERIVVASGDHIFAESVAELERGGWSVKVVYPPQSISHLLYKAASDSEPLAIVETRSAA